MPLNASKNRAYNFIDLFCGAGGFTEGFLLADHEKYNLIAASDINETAMLTHTNRFKKQLNLEYLFLTKSITDKDFIPSLIDGIGKYLPAHKEIDVICGGPPCQGFSVFGPRQEKDPRNSLFSYYLKVIKQLKPKYFIMENVPGLAQMYKGKAVNKIYETVSKIKPKYNLVGPLFINSADFGVPQTRQRIIFIGCREDMPIIESLEPTIKPEKYITSGEAIDDLSFLQPWESASSYSEEIKPNSRYQRDSRRGRLFKEMGIRRLDKELTNHEAAKHTPLVMARFAAIRKGRGLDSIPRALWEKHLKTEKKWCVKLDDSKLAYTVVTLPDDFVHYSSARVLTVRELARLQSFDDTFVFYGPRSTGGGGAGNKKRRVELPQYTQVGNAVPPLVAKAIANTVLSSLESVSGNSKLNHNNVVYLRKAV